LEASGYKASLVAIDIAVFVDFTLEEPACGYKAFVVFENLSPADWCNSRL
jgi:hypothetical protein